MLINLFSTVRNYGVPATLKEFLDLPIIIGITKMKDTMV